METLFVGREQELKFAAELLEVAQSGVEAVYCIEGGAGIGKTELCHRIVQMFCDAGLLVLKSSFVDGQELPPLWPWRRILAKAVQLSLRSFDQLLSSKLIERHTLLLNHLESN